VLSASWRAPGEENIRAIGHHWSSPGAYLRFLSIIKVRQVGLCAMTGDRNFEPPGRSNDPGLKTAIAQRLQEMLEIMLADNCQVVS